LWIKPRMPQGIDRHWRLVAFLRHIRF
jgi:hypothetical protein